MKSFPKIGKITKEYLDRCVHEGWFDLILELVEKIKVIYPECEVHQIKEKFGGLRFYIGGAPKEVHDLIRKYEEKSYKICEKCGKSGKLRTDIGWYLTLCNEHYKRRKSRGR